jgi:hypothetical protein
MYTGVTFFHMWFRPFMQALTQTATDAVSSFDCPQNVPKEKKQTQLARVIAGKKSAAKKQKLIEYDERMEFEDDGIFMPGRREATLEKFDMRAIQKGSRTLRSKLWIYVLQKLKSASIPDSRVFYFENDSVSAWKFDGSKPFERDPTTSHNHGESDPSLAFWVEKTCFHCPEGKTAIVKSKDGDLVPILLHAIEMQERHAPAHWVRKPVYWVAKFNEIYDMRVYYNQLKSRLRFTESQYMIYIILNGTDFHPKALLCHGFGVKDIFNAFEIVRKAFELWDTESAPTDPERIKLEQQSLITFVRQLYHDDITGGVPRVVLCKNNQHVDFTPRLHSLARLREMFAAKRGRKQVPTDEAILKAYQNISFTYRYWRDRSKWPKGMFGTTPASRPHTGGLVPRAAPLHVEEKDEEEEEEEEEEVGESATQAYSVRTAADFFKSRSRKQQSEPAAAAAAAASSFPPPKVRVSAASVIAAAKPAYERKVTSADFESLVQSMASKAPESKVQDEEEEEEDEWEEVGDRPPTTATYAASAAAADSLVKELDEYALVCKAELEAAGPPAQRKPTRSACADIFQGVVNRVTKGSSLSSSGNSNKRKAQSS